MLCRLCRFILCTVISCTRTVDLGQCELHRSCIQASSARCLRTGLDCCDKTIQCSMDVFQPGIRFISQTSITTATELPQRINTTAHTGPIAAHLKRMDFCRRTVLLRNQTALLQTHCVHLLHTTARGQIGAATQRNVDGSCRQVIGQSLGMAPTDREAALRLSVRRGFLLPLLRL